MYATGKQINFIKFLATDRGYDNAIDARRQFDGVINSISSMTVRDASLMIDWLKSEPRRQAA